MPVEKDVVVVRGCSQTAAVRWCYFFTVLHIRRRLIFTLYDGTEDGTRYVWKDWNWPLRWEEERKEGYEMCRRELLTPR